MAENPGRVRRLVCGFRHGGAEVRRRECARSAAVALVSAALLDVRGSAFARKLLTVGVPTSEDEDFVTHMQVVAAKTVDLPHLIADPYGTFNGHTLPEWLALLADGEDPGARWVRAVLATTGYRPE